MGQSTPFRPVVSPSQCRAARALLQWTQAGLAARSDVARKTIADFESERRIVHRRTRLDLTAAFEAAGVEFLWEGDSSGAGVRLVGVSAAARAS